MNAQKMKLLEPEMKNYQNSIQRMQRAGDYEGIKHARSAYRQMQEKFGFDTLVPALNLLQVSIT